MAHENEITITTRYSSSKATASSRVIDLNMNFVRGGKTNT